jgi:hypothetical protein
MPFAQLSAMAVSVFLAYRMPAKLLSGSLQTAEQRLRSRQQWRLPFVAHVAAASVMH